MHAMEKIPTDIRPSRQKEAGAASMAIGIRPEHNGSKGPHQKSRSKRHQ